ncbi:hypothetical protein niasHS_004437 [Heterodera schachtii]|uniref:BTB domain-containing protein n=1 Tax=Heterodera schachtii TaxID=97005 RepID=A0ABD2JR29_HETSC
MSKTAIDGLKLMLSTGEYADVQFLVGDGDAKELLSAHKLILNLASDVFKAMFRFDAKKEQGKNASTNYPAVVEVPDVEAAAFKVMLRFIYTDDLSGLNGDNAMAVLCAAKKYNIPGLVAPSLQIPISKLRNVFVAYAYVCLFDLKDFANCCLSYIDKNAYTLIKSEEFLQIDQKTLCEIFGRDELQIHEEITIWKACRQNGIECSAENRRQLLGPALFKIRFPLLSREEFEKDIDFYSSIRRINNSRSDRRSTTQIKPNFDQFNSEERIWTFGTITMDIEKVSEFAGADVRSCRFSKTVHIKGLPWQIVAQINPKIMRHSKPIGRRIYNEKWLGIYLLCVGPKNDKHWRCKCSLNCQILSQKSGVADYKKGPSKSQLFFSDMNGRGFSNFASFAELMDPSNGFYNQKEDKVTLAIDFTVKDENPMIGDYFKYADSLFCWSSGFLQFGN